MKRILMIIIALSLIVVGCKKKEGCTDVTATNYDADAKKDDASCVYNNTVTVSTGTLTSTGTDLCGNSIPTTVKIGNQEWMTTNLNTTKFSNGDNIPLAQTNQDWVDAYNNKTPICGYYNHSTANGKTYGLLYNWYALTDLRGLAPNGYHIATKEETDILDDLIAPSSTPNDLTHDYIKIGLELKSKCGWNDHNGQSYNGNDTYGLNIVPSGIFEPFDPMLNAPKYSTHEGDICELWLAYDQNNNTGWVYAFAGGFASYNGEGGLRWEYNNAVATSRSIRCIKD